MTLASRFEGRTAIVTGAATGIGRATVLRLVGEGARVLGVDLNEAGLIETVTLAQAAASYGGKASHVVASVSDEAEAKRIADDFVRREGRLDVLVNLAGILRSTHTTETTLAQFLEVVQTNLTGTFLWCRECLPFLIESRGSIVNAASTSAFFGHPYMAAYAASKGGIVALTHTLAREYIRKGVRVNAVAPGGIQTPMVETQRSGFPAGADLTLFATLMRPDQQLGLPEHVAGVIAMLASDDGAFISGEVIRIDGGTHS